MLGVRLRRSDAIARKRSKRRPESTAPKGRWRKSNGTCSCPMCRGPRYSRKGKREKTEA